MRRQLTVGCLLVSLLTALASCSSPAPQPEIEVHFTSIALVSPREILDATQPRTRSDRAQEGAGRGLTAGTIGGAAVGALACGPFLYGLCITALAGAGMLAGAAGGALYGFTGFPEDLAMELERRIEALGRERDVPSILVGHIRQRVPAEMLAEPESAEIQAVLTIDKVEFIKDQGKVHLVSTVRVTFESTESRRVPEFGYRIFRGTSDNYELEQWLDVSSPDLEEALRQSLLTVSGEIVSVLKDRWRPSAI